ncbi:hypothetical protein GDO78_000632 [Eleutherodactylus coqui]|uniref:Uncharacterized protein n=1 Tax=Eleutherodactylus coqui TaxID=57060 RepID=A0A8J6FQK7_ELECQ|nr:hypothetical protein GDO78_000632 [Eleutherodactylus coqui]
MVVLPVIMMCSCAGKLDTFDVKSLFLPAKASCLQDPGSKKKLNKSQKSPGASQHGRKKACVKHWVPKIQQVEDFKALSKLLLYAVKWCKERKLKAAAVFFRNRYLRCNRLQHAEALGYSLKKKLQFWKKSMCHSLHQPTLGKDDLKGCLTIQRLQQPWKCVVAHSQRHRRVKRKDFKRPLLRSDLFPDEQKPSSDAAPRPWTSELQESSTTGTDGCPTHADQDIDDIFSSIGI